ncbi:MAG: AMP-binding protein [Nitriliruptor sp.]|uniref:AMP-binding protein n=1 Tax=Nitriliruptor sp. TaxID=2448056 RepID=UPI0034A078B2
MARLIALPLPSTGEAAEAVRARWEAGDAVLPLDPEASRAEVEALLAALRPDRLASFDDPDGCALPDPLPTDDGVALVVATSGSTGTRKGVTLTSAALDASTAASLARLGVQHDAVWRVPLPLHHVAGLAALRRGWALGTTPDVVAPGDLDALLRPGADHVAVVPTQLHRWLARDGAAGPRQVLLGGAAASGDLLERAAVAGIEVVTSYGMTETCGGCVYDGHPLAGAEVALAGDDRIRLRGEMLFSGYRGDPTATAATVDDDGWFTTSDVGRLGEDGRLTVLGRADDVVVSGGENVPLAVVVAALRSHPDVADATAVGEPDPEWGERVHAVVVPRDLAAPPTEADLREHVRGDHPAAFAPRRVTFVQELPRDAMGKVTRSSLRAAIAVARG